MNQVVVIATRIRNCMFIIVFVQCEFLTKLFVSDEVGHLLTSPTHFRRLPRHAEAEGPLAQTDN